MNSTNGGVVQFFALKSVLITGTSGFLGKVVIEKILRSCPDVVQIFCVLRQKSDEQTVFCFNKFNQSQVEQRMKEVLESDLFDTIRDTNPGCLKKIVPVKGNIELPYLGLSDEDRKRVCCSVEIFIHSAATVKFDEPLKVALKTNVLGTYHALQLAKDIPNLKSMVHVSSAYANCIYYEPEERFYSPPFDVDPIRLLDEQSWLDLDKLEKFLVPKTFPNTYTLTKNLSEALIHKMCFPNGWKEDAHSQIPIVIVRPSIIISTAAEPKQGWVDSMNGSTLLLGCMREGYLRVMRGNGSNVADVVPVDTVSNTILVSAWDLVQYLQTRVAHPAGPVPIYHVCTSNLSYPVTWHELVEGAKKTAAPFPMCSFRLTPSEIKYWLLRLIEVELLGTVMDLTRAVLLKPPRYRKALLKLLHNSGKFEAFTLNEWRFKIPNLIALKARLSEEDRRIFGIDLLSMDMNQLLDDYYGGIDKVFRKASRTRKPQKLTFSQRLHGLLNLIYFLLTLLVAYICRGHCFGAILYIWKQLRYYASKGSSALIFAPELLKSYGLHLF